MVSESTQASAAGGGTLNMPGICRGRIPSGTAHWRMCIDPARSLAAWRSGIGRGIGSRLSRPASPGTFRPDTECMCLGTLGCPRMCQADTGCSRCRWQDLRRCTRGRGHRDRVGSRRLCARSFLWGSLACIEGMQWTQPMSCIGCLCKGSRSCCLWLLLWARLFQLGSSCKPCLQRRICQSRFLACIAYRMKSLPGPRHCNKHTCLVRMLCRWLQQSAAKHCLLRTQYSWCCPWRRCTCPLDSSCILRFAPRRSLPFPQCRSMCPWDSSGIRRRIPMSRCLLCS